MPGLPLGAAQQHPVDPELQSYEAITSIEFVEFTPDEPCARSAAYRPTETGADLRIRNHMPDLVDSTLTVPEAHAYIEALASAGLFTWNRVYRPAQGTFTLEGLQWRLKVAFAKPAQGKKCRAFRVEGEGSYPEGYERMIGLLLNEGEQL